MKREAKAWVGAAAGFAALALLLSGCTQPGVDDGTDSTATSSASGASTDLIDAAHSVGAMDDFQVGDTFKATEPIDISLMYRDMPNYPVKDDWLLFSQIEANQNVTFTRTDIPFADWQTKRGLTITGGDAPELMPVFYSGEETAYAGSGVLLPISDYLEYMPNFSALLDDWDLRDYFETKAQSDGKVYHLPGLMEIAKVQYSIIVRDDMWEAAGLTDDPATMEDLQAALQALKDTGLCTSGYPLSAANNAKDIMAQFSPGYGTSLGDWSIQGSSAVWDEDAGEYVFAGMQEGNKELVTYLAGLVSSGLMDPESMTQSTTDNTAAAAKFTSGQSCAMTGNDQDANNAQKTIQENGIDTTVHMLRVPEGPAGDLISGGQRFSSGMIFSSALADDPHFKAILQFVDWLYFSEEGVEFAQWGVQCDDGATDSSTCTYTKDADGVRTLMSDINNAQGLNPAGTKMLTPDYGFGNGVFWPANGTYKDLMLSYYSPIMADFAEKMADKGETATAPPTPMDDDTLQQTGALYTALRDAVNTADTKFILGQQPMSDWDAYVSQLQSLSVDQYIQLYNDAVKQ
ncbi:MAG: extracellular solute-binding protein [Propionibacteriaceae bacterium]|jgi:putative aldouronate transport system substrate-binding protein|nr:extracellular solute-binding protein [Propionibacteriaceae bacterium]